MSLKSGAVLVGKSVLWIVGFVALLAVPAVLLVGAVAATKVVLPWLVLASMVAFAVCLLGFVPLAIVPSTRLIAGHCFFYSSYLFGLTTFLMGLLLTWSIYGGIAVIVGLLVFGVGVVPIGMVAALFRGRWADLGVLALTLALTLGARSLGFWLIQSGARAEELARIPPESPEPGGAAPDGDEW